MKKTLSWRLLCTNMFIVQKLNTKARFLSAQVIFKEFMGKVSIRKEIFVADVFIF